MGDPNPFVAHASPALPRPPKPCAQPPASRSRTPPKRLAVETDFDDEKQYLEDIDEPYKSASLQSSSSEFMMNPGAGSPTDLEKASLAHEHHRQHQHHHHQSHRHSTSTNGNQSRRSSRQHRSSHRYHSRQSLNTNPQSEKPHRIIHTSSSLPANPSMLQPETPLQTTRGASATDNANDPETSSLSPAPGRATQEAHALRILLFLSGPCELLSLLNLFWSLIALFITLLSQPVRICARRPNVSQQLAGLLGPSLNLQLRAIFTPLPPHADEDASYFSPRLVAVHLLSPVLGLGVVVCAWVLAVYWAASCVVGDPAGQDKRDDGREAVLGLRSWWEGWLLRCVKVDDQEMV